MEGQIDRIDTAFDLVAETCPCLKPHNAILEAEMHKLKEDYGDSLAYPAATTRFMTLATGEISRDLHYLLEQAIDHMDEDRA